MKTNANNRNNYNLFDFLGQLEKQEKLDQLKIEVGEEEIVEGKDCYLGYHSSPEASILIYDYEHKKEQQYGCIVERHNGYIYVCKQKINIDIYHVEPPSLDNRYHITLDEANNLPLPNNKFSYKTAFFRTLEDLIKFIKSDLKDTTLIYDQNDFYMEGNEWRYDD